MIFIEVEARFRDLVSVELLRGTALKSLHFIEQEEQPSLSVKITGDQEIQSLNSQYRGFDKPTDVLSFEADYYDPDLGSRYLGDVVISYPRAADQAANRGHHIHEELQLLVIHGVLHLLGFDHGTAEEKSSMWRAQAQILASLGLDIQVEDEEGS